MNKERCSLTPSIAKHNIGNREKEEINIDHLGKVALKHHVSIN